MTVRVVTVLTMFAATAHAMRRVTRAVVWLDLRALVCRFPMVSRPTVASVRLLAIRRVVTTERVMGPVAVSFGRRALFVLRRCARTTSTHPILTVTASRVCTLILHRVRLGCCVRMRRTASRLVLFTVIAGMLALCTATPLALVVPVTVCRFGRLGRHVCLTIRV